MRHLYANGDSNTLGEELGEDETGYIDFQYRENFCYVGRLAKLYGLESWTNDAIGGGSNDRMFRCTMKFTSKWIADGNDPRDLFVVIGWSNCTRREFYYEPEIEEGDEFNKDEMNRLPEQENRYFRTFVGMHKSKRLRFNDETMKDFALMYNRWFSHLPSSMTRTVNYIVALQSYLECNNIPYLFFNSAWVIDTTNCECTELAGMIDQTRFLGVFDRMETMSGWTWKNGHKGRFPRGHMDANAHAAWAANLFDYIEGNKLRIME